MLRVCNAQVRLVAHLTLGTKVGFAENMCGVQTSWHVCSADSIAALTFLPVLTGSDLPIAH